MVQSCRQAKTVVVGPLLALVLGLLAGCAAKDIAVMNSAMTEDAAFIWLASVPTNPRDRFSVQADKASLHVRFAPNFVGMHQLFRAEWYMPGGRLYLRSPAETFWGSHMDLVTAMLIRDEPPSQRPGTWRVKLYLEDELLTEQSFEIYVPEDIEIARAAAAEAQPVEGEGLVAGSTGLFEQDMLVAVGFPNRAPQE